MSKLALTIIACFAGYAAMAQSPKFTVTVSSDTVLVGNYFELKFTVENASAKGFEAPDLHEFNVIGGPNSSTSISIVNGEMNQSATYTYYLEPPDIGVYTIKPAYLSSDEAQLETPPIDIIVVPNPDGIVQRPHEAGQRIDYFSIPQPADTIPKRPRRKF